MESVSYTDVCCMCHSCPQNQYDFNVASLAKSKTERSMVSRCAFIAEREGPWCVCVCVCFIAEKEGAWLVCVCVCHCREGLSMVSVCVSLQRRKVHGQCVCHCREGRCMISVCVIAEKEGAWSVCVSLQRRRVHG